MRAGITLSSGLVILAVAALAITSSAAELDERLGFLEPLIGPVWVGGYVGEDAPDLVITMGFEPILDGRAVRCVRQAEGADYSASTRIYWHPGREEVRFVSLDNRGMVAEGIVSVEDGRIVLQGKNHRPDGMTEYETRWEIDPQGTLRDTFLRRQGDELVQGHLQEFTAKEK